jgi:FSR family fosmidomycin resistance protein-like MFS transporter
MGLFDEILAGFSAIGLPLFRKQLGLSYTQIGVIFTVSALFGMVLEPLINLLSDRGPKRYWILSGLVISTFGFILKASTQSFVLLLLAFSITSPAGDAAVGLSQAALVELTPTRATQVMARWTFLSSIGDLLAPLILVAIVGIHLGWAGLWWLATSLWLVVTVIVGTSHFPKPSQAVENEDISDKKTLLAGLREALRDPILLRWSILTVIPTMVDEVFLVFTALYLRDVLHASPEAVGIVIAIHTVGALLGLFALDRFLLRWSTPRQLLLWLSLLVLIGMLCLLSFHSLWAATLALFVIGLGASSWYPIAKGQAYSRFPGCVGTVRAVISLFAALDVALPGLVSILVDRFGLIAGLGFLGLAPVLMLFLLVGMPDTKRESNQKSQ